MVESAGVRLSALLRANLAFDGETLAGTPQHVTVSGSRGNPTTVASLVQGATTLNRTFTYFDTGNVNQATDANSALTTYTYGACGNSFPTNVAEPLSLSRQMTWNCTGGVQLTDVDENNKTTTAAYSDPYFWRPASVTDRSTAVTSLCYGLVSGTCTINPTQTETTLTFNSGASTSDVLTTVDSLGRIMLNQQRQAPGSANFDTTRQIYNTVGLPSRVMLPYVGTAGQANGSGANVTTTYDALGRPTAVQDSASGITNYSYIQGSGPNNDVLVTIGPAPTGENTKRRQLEYDGLGRLRSVCEMSGGTGSGSCGQVVVQTGYWTKYTYDALGNLTGITQNAQAAAGSQQTRSYSYDGLSRLTSETNPESGTITYIWDSATVGVCSATSKGDLIVRTNAAGVSACNTYDALHRPLSVGHNPAQANSTPDRFFVYDAATVNGVTMTNTKTRLAEAYTCLSPCTKITDEGFSYTARGEVSDLWESTPHSAGFYHTAATYWANGALNVLNAAGGTTYNMSWIPDGEGRVSSTTDGSGTHPLAGTTYSAASLPKQLTFGSGDSDTFTYDSNTNRMVQYKFTVGTSPQSVIGNLTWNANGTLNQLAITDPLNSANAQTCNYTHDDLIRIATANCGTAANQTFTYDAFGNLNKTGSPFGFSATYSISTNRMTSISGSTPTYDANGNVTNDFLHTYAWDADGQAATVDGVGLTYDALGRVVEQNRSGSFTQFAYSPTGFKMQLLNGQSAQKDWVPLPAGATAVYSATLNVRHPDWLGSSRFSSDLNARTMSSDTAYDPFGGAYAQAGTTDLSFTGKDQDTSGSLYDFPARKYGIQGRWPSPDPAGLAAANLAFPQAWNRYAYVQNNPLNFFDPFGLCGASASRSGKPMNWCPGEDGGLPFGFDTFDIIARAYTRTGTRNDAGCPAGDCANPAIYGNIGLLALLGGRGSGGRGRGGLPTMGPMIPTMGTHVCSAKDVFMSSFDFSLKVGLEANFGNVLKVGGSFFRSLTTGQTGGSAGVRAIVGYELSRVNPPGVPINVDVGQPTHSFSIGPFQKNVTTGESSGTISFGGAVGLGAEVSFDPAKFDRLVRACTGFTD